MPKPCLRALRALRVEACRLIVSLAVCLAAAATPAQAGDAEIAESFFRDGRAVFASDPDQALEFFYQAIVAAPDFHLAHAWIGRSFAWREDYIEARRYYAASLDIAPDARNVLLWDGEAAIELGDYDALQDILERLGDYCRDCDEYVELKRLADRAFP